MPAKAQFTTLAIAATLVFGASARAAPMSSSETGTVSVRVSVADLDLRHEAGLAAAHRRIQRAAAVVCGNEPASSGLALYAASKSCRKAAFDGAVADLDTQVASMLALRSGPRETALAVYR
jgi:UrcA family protein